MGDMYQLLPLYSNICASALSMKRKSRHVSMNERLNPHLNWDDLPWCENVYVGDFEDVCEFFRFCLLSLGNSQCRSSSQRHQ